MGRFGAPPYLGPSPSAMIKTKSVHETIDPEADGLRLLVSRLRGRGLPKTRYDVWMASLGPSQALLSAFRAGRITWPEFSRRYGRELFEDARLDAGNPQIKNHGQKFTLRLLQELGRRGHVTLLCHCAADEPHCHRHLLQRILARPRL